MMHKAICSECGKECELPFKPTGNKPVFCSNCFGNKANSNRPRGRDYKKEFNFHDSTGGKNTEQFKEQFEILNAKLDNILKLLTPIVSTEVEREQKVTRKTEVSKTKKVAKQQTKRTVSPKKTIKKKAVAKKTVAKKVTRKKKN